MFRIFDRKSPKAFVAKFCTEINNTEFYYIATLALDKNLILKTYVKKAETEKLVEIASDDIVKAGNIVSDNSGIICNIIKVLILQNKTIEYSNFPSAIKADKRYAKVLAESFNSRNQDNQK